MDDVGLLNDTCKSPVVKKTIIPVKEPTDDEEKQEQTNDEENQEQIDDEENQEHKEVEKKETTTKGKRKLIKVLKNQFFI